MGAQQELNGSYKAGESGGQRERRGPGGGEEPGERRRSPSCSMGEMTERNMGGAWRGRDEHGEREERRGRDGQGEKEDWRGRDGQGKREKSRVLCKGYTVANMRESRARGGSTWSGGGSRGEERRRTWRKLLKE